MIDLYAAIRERIDAPPTLTTDMSDRAALANLLIALGVETIEAELAAHVPSYSSGVVEYEEHDERAYDRTGKPIGYIRLTGAAKPPDWCSECGEHTPCFGIRRLADRLGIHDWLTASDPEPPKGTTVATQDGTTWWRMPWLVLPDACLRADTDGRADGEPTSWATVTGEYGPVRIVGEPA